MMKKKITLTLEINCELSEEVNNELLQKWAAENMFESGVYVIGFQDGEEVQLFMDGTSISNFNVI